MELIIIICDRERMSIQQLHNTQIRYFEKQKDFLPKLEETLTRLRAVKSKCKKLLIVLDWDKKTRLEALEKELEQKIQVLKTNKEYIEYLLVSGRSVQHQQQLVSFIDDIQACAPRLHAIYEIKQVKDALNEFRSKRKQINIDNERMVCDICQLPIVDKTLNGGFYKCSNCGCSMEDKTGSSMDYSCQAPKAAQYKERNHLNEMLARSQGLENTIIDASVLQTLRNEMFKRRMILDRITPDDVRRLLRYVGLTQFFEHRVKIWALLTGKRPPTLTQQQSAMVKAMFDMILTPFEQCPDVLKYDVDTNKLRKNFLSYEYVLYKLCELLHLNQLVKQFKVIKSTKILKQHDRIWRFICDCLGWPVNPTDYLNNFKSKTHRLNDK